MSARDFGERLRDSFTWYLRVRETPTDVLKKIEVQDRAIRDLYSLMAHALEVMAFLEGLPPEQLGRKLYLPTGLEYSGSLKKFG